MKRIPKENRDLARYVLKKDLLRILGFLLWMIALGGGAEAYNNNHQTYPPERLMLGWKLHLWLTVAALSGFLIFRLWKFITDRGFCGTVVSNENSRTYSPSEDPGSSEYDFRLNTRLKIRMPNGRTRRIRFEQKNGFYQYYHEGNRIRKIHGLPYPVNLDPTASCGYVCSACGTWTRERPERCEKCNHTVIDPKKLS